MSQREGEERTGTGRRGGRERKNIFGLNLNVCMIVRILTQKFRDVFTFFCFGNVGSFQSLTILLKKNHMTGIFVHTSQFLINNWHTESGFIVHFKIKFILILLTCVSIPLTPHCTLTQAPQSNPHSGRFCSPPASSTLPFPSHALFSVFRDYNHIHPNLHTCRHTL